MTFQQRFTRNILCIMLMLITISILAPITETYESLGYSSFIKLLDTEDVDEILYSDSGKYAVVHQISTDTKYKVGVASLDNFENDVYNYSLAKDDFNYASFVPKSKIDSLGVFVIALTFSSLVGFAWTKIMLRRLAKNKDKDKDAQNRSPFNYDRLTTGSKLFESYKPRKIKDVDVTFKDVIGLDKQIDELQDVVRFLKEPQLYEQIGAHLPHGILLYGNPGVGKTHIARAIAGEAGVPFFVISASEIQAKYLGESEERIRNLFNEAESCAPSIIFFDELDSIAVQRFSKYSNEYSASIVNQLLACMDGFTRDTKIIVIASTNHIDTLDSALLRPGRFDKKIYIHEPDREARKQLFEYYSTDKVLAPVVDIERFVDVTSGLTGADIKSILNEAAILSVRKGHTAIDEDTIMEAFRQVELGTENSGVVPSKENQRRTAIHEAGHAIISNYFGQTVSEISIIARGKAAGYNLAPPSETQNYIFDELKHKVMMLLGGRAAEEVEYGEVSAGASSDLKKASSIVEDMFLRFSLRNDNEISLVLTDDSHFNEMVEKDSYENMKGFIKTCYEETRRIIEERKPLLMYLTQRLLDKEVLSKKEIEEIFSSKNY